MIAFLIHLIILGLAVAQGPEELTADNFDAQVKQKENALVMFYAPWCGHCKRVKPDFEAAAKELHASKPNIKLARVDCTTNEKICSKFGVTGYPTIKFFKNGEVSSDYSGSRDKDGFVRFMTQRSQPASQALSSTADLDELLNSDAARIQPLVITYVKSESDPWLKTFMALAGQHLDDAMFRHVFDASIADLSDTSRVRLYRPKSLHIKLEESTIKYDGELSDSLSQWILDQSFGMVGYRSPANRKFFASSDLLVLYNNVSIDKHPKGVNYYRNRLIKLLREMDNSSPKLTFAYSFSGDFHHEVSEFGHDMNGELPFVGIFSGGKKYKLDKYEPEAFVEFIKKFRAGKLEPYLKSEPIPTDQTELPMKVVALNFDEIVNDPKKDVFIMFHAPWCGHCKQLKPKFESLAKKLQNEPGVLLVTFDATANDVPRPFTVQGYPTLYFVPKNDKQNPKSYEGQREEDDLFKYIAKESSDELVGFDRQGEPKKVEL